MKEAFHWIEHLFWEIGWAFISLLKGNVSGAIEMLYWIKIHVTYQGERIPVRLTLAESIKMRCIAIIGLSLVVFVCILIGYLIQEIIW